MPIEGILWTKFQQTIDKHKKIIDKKETKKGFQVSSQEVLANYNAGLVNQANRDFQKEFKKLQQNLDETCDDDYLKTCILKNTTPENIKLASLLVNSEEARMPEDLYVNILKTTNKQNFELAKELCTNKNLNVKPSQISEYLKYTFTKNSKEAENNLKEAKEVINDCNNGKISTKIANLILDKRRNISYDNYKKLITKMNVDTVENLRNPEIEIATKFVDFYEKQTVDELSIEEKRNLVRTLVANNISLYFISDNINPKFPLVPKSLDDYCALLTSLTTSIGILTNSITPNQEKKMYKELNNLSISLEKMPDLKFNEMTISQEYSTKDFIKNANNLLENLDKTERQKVFDYFGFELKKRGNSIELTGYPVNLKDDKNLPKIDNEETKKVIEELKPYVIKYSENNPILCSNKNVEKSLNSIVEVFPELRTTIEKQQHSTQSFDVMKHSLKVMQKVVQNPQYNKLNTSDKNLILLASLFHDITKKEGIVDKAHAEESAIDTFYITRKLNLPQNEKNKLYALCKFHEWLAYVNNDKISPEERENRIKSVAFDLKPDNLFEMSKIFTEADLKSVKDNDGFYDIFSQDLKIHSKKIQDHIMEFKKSQALLPVTQFPSSSTINKAITTVRHDGSTNIKGVYKNKNGLIILKFNEIDDWEEIGFPKGSTSKSIKLGEKRKILNKNLHQIKQLKTGNIKFFAHGLDSKNQLVKFNNFALPDSNAILSVSYAGKPETQYRFFRNQGVILNADTNSILGGSEIDSYSGFKKNITRFKENYIINGDNEDELFYVPNLIKKYLNLTDDEYVKFVQKNQNKSLTEIEPIETRNKLIKAYSTMQSKTDHFDSCYNEIYVVNPQVMAVFAYNFFDNPIGDVISFVDKQPNFLEEYALNNDLPFVVLGE
jgi:hypothetical protein